MVEYLSKKRIRKSLFYATAGLKRGLLDTDKMSAAVKDTDIAKILAAYPDINPEWLITGEGDMIKKKNAETLISQNLKGDNNIMSGHDSCMHGRVDGLNPELIALYKRIIAEQEEQIKIKDEQIKKLLEIATK